MRMFAGSYCGSPPSLAEVATRWNFDPALLAVLALGLALSLRAGNRLATIGIALLAIAFVSPLCAASVTLFSARALHHLLLILGALCFAMAMRESEASSRLARSLFRQRVPVGPATIVMTAVLWGWHVPSLYDAALADMLVYWTMQLSILAASFAFWLAVRRASAVGAVGGLLGGTVQMGFLSALLTFAAQPLYRIHIAAAPSWGISPLTDQQLAGLIMWVGGMAPFAIGAAANARKAWARQNAAQPASIVSRNPA
ncbi:cytochrome c oxidase assembly protein [Qipengyuania spongiae]|uniref:Cytochrome c oxidase assembly protein n=1 Tax=Qipengyuania spongiae TaxID=2909673 RepID=A0ABY5SYC0_9SPHN|nr:cytochrome c oxidase assembly protein [Qipengyuania spongiae]UVI39537.1 cytochrome c oxidase assembly protein [Qipengyuania spongiae]